MRGQGKKKKWEKLTRGKKKVYQIRKRKEDPPLRVPVYLSTSSVAFSCAF